jgi:hypothetical protein
MHRRPRLTRFAPALAGTALLVVLAGCGSNDVPPAPDAAGPACRALTGRLPARVLDRARNEAGPAGTAGWGDPAIVLRCGVPPPRPTTDPCLEVNGLDWVFTETKQAFRFVSYGRVPAVEITVPAEVDRTTAPGALVDLAGAVRPLTTTASKCY